MDFTLSRYQSLLKALISGGYSFQTFSGFLASNVKRVVILRHDVDKIPENSRETAKIENDLGLTGTYFFRILPCSFNPYIIKEIHSLGHEIGYHYEDLVIAGQKTRSIIYKGQGNVFRPEIKNRVLNPGSKDQLCFEKELAESAIQSFAGNLAKMRTIAPVKTICMHGSPLSRWDSRLLWKYYDYNDFGIIGEPYFDINFEKMLYLTDTGRRWDGKNFSVRDKVKGQKANYSGHKAQEHFPGSDFFKDWKVKPLQGSLINMTLAGMEFQNKFKFRSTVDIINSVRNGAFPDRAMINFHPQRWNNKQWPWIKELIWQKIKNKGKYFLIKMRNKQESGKISDI